MNDKKLKVIDDMSNLDRALHHPSLDETVVWMLSPPPQLGMRKIFPRPKKRKCSKCDETFIPKRAGHFQCYECFEPEGEK